MTTSTGTTISLASGKPTFVFFGYTKCPDVCPTTLADWARVRQRLGNKADNVQFVFVSVDPERDSPDVAQQYASKFDQAIIGVSPDSATSSTLQRALGASSFREGTGTGGDYLVAHSAHTFLIDGKGNLIAFYAFGSGWDAMLHDVETLL
jgi:protein SCO1/2